MANNNSSLRFEVITDIKEAENIWKKMSPNSNIYENWEFRYCFYKYFSHPLHFLTGMENGEIIGLLPMQYNEEKKYLEFFGGTFMEDNGVYIKEEYEKYIPRFYGAIDKPARLEDIVEVDAFTKSLDVLEYKYIADLSGLKSIEDYLKKHFKAKSRNKLRNKIKAIESMNLEIILNNFDDIDTMIDLNKAAFGEESTFHKPFRREIFHDLLKLNFEHYLFSFIINGKKEAVTMSIKYNDTFININAGVNKKDISNLGTYTIYKKLEKAISLKSKLFDAGIGDLGWKEIWHLEKIPLRIFTWK